MVDIMKAYNKRLKHTTDLISIDYEAKKARLVQPDAKPRFIYDEALENVQILEATGVVLNGEDIYVGDEVIAVKKKDKFIVKKIPGGYLPFSMPVKMHFEKVK